MRELELAGWQLLGAASSLVDILLGQGALAEHLTWVGEGRAGEECDGSEALHVCNYGKDCLCLNE